MQEVNRILVSNKYNQEGKILQLKMTLKFFEEGMEDLHKEFLGQGIFTPSNTVSESSAEERICYGFYFQNYLN